MGLWDIFRRIRGSSGTYRPTSLPGHVTAYDAATDHGTIELENGQRLSFTSASLGGTKPERYQGVLVTGIKGAAAAEAQVLSYGVATPVDQYEPAPPEPHVPAPPREPREPRERPVYHEPENPELERALAESPDDIEAHLVLGDWLQGKGHPRGELIALMARLEQEPRDGALKDRIEALFREHQAALVGELFGGVDLMVEGQDGRITLQDRERGGKRRSPTTHWTIGLEGPEPRRVILGWRLGFIESARVADIGDTRSDLGADDLLDELLQHPSSRRLRALTLGLMNNEAEPEHCYLTALETIRAFGPLPTLEKLFIGDFVYPDEMEMSWAGIGDLGRIWPLLPNLREVILQAGNMYLGEIDLPRLRSFEVRTGGLDLTDIRSICTARWPELERLVVWFGAEEYGAEGTLEDIEPLLSGENLKKVTHLGLMNCEFTDAICHALPRSAIAAQLEVLDLSLGTMSDEGARALAEGAGAFPRLRRLDVAQNFLTDAGVQALEGAGWEVAAYEQEEPDEGHRYVTVGE
jgi:uncharacterized protein (TIGR02996 family)